MELLLIEDAYFTTIIGYCSWHAVWEYFWISWCLCSIFLLIVAFIMLCFGNFIFSLLLMSAILVAFWNVSWDACFMVFSSVFFIVWIFLAHVCVTLVFIVEILLTVFSFCFVYCTAVCNSSNLVVIWLSAFMLELLCLSWHNSIFCSLFLFYWLVGVYIKWVRDGLLTCFWYLHILKFVLFCNFDVDFILPFLSVDVFSYVKMCCSILNRHKSPNNLLMEHTLEGRIIFLFAVICWSVNIAAIMDAWFCVSVVC